MSRLTAYSTNSFGGPNAQPPTPSQTPTSATFPSPVFASPQQHQGEFTEPGSWTPRFAEDYSVFNTTPGNLKGGQAQFTGFVPFTPTSEPGGHKRLLSSDSTSTEIQPQLDQFSPNLPAPFQPLASQALPATGQTQTATPPPTSNKEGRKLAPKLKMQQDGQEYPQPDFSGPQPNDLTGFLGSPGDLFSYPMSAPVTGPEHNFWDPASLDMPMDMDFSTTDIFDTNPNPMPISNHRHSTSFDWNSEVHMFQSPPQPAPVPAKKQQKVKPAAKKARALAPKPPAAEQNVAANAAAPHPVLMSNVSMENNPFAMGPADAVNPGILFSRPQTAAAGGSFNMMPNMGQAEAAIAASTGFPDNNVRRSMNVRDARNGKLPDRASASSPIKSFSARPGLSRSQSENRGKKPIGRNTVVNQSARPIAPARNAPSLDASRLPRSGRVSPMKRQHRLSGLASIPESANHAGSRASVKFYIGADGRAHAEAAGSGGRPGSNGGSRSRSSDGQPEDEDSESSSDDEPIIIPSRSTSFNTSFALPDPRKPVGSIFHPSRRSISDRSTSTIAASDGTQNISDAASEADTIMDAGDQEGGNAANELLKVRENRQHLSNSFSGLKSQRLFGLPGGAHGNSISPTRTDSGNTTDEPGVRCVCHRNEFTGFLVQW